MLDSIQFSSLSSNRKIYKKVPAEYKEELMLYLVFTNISREAILAIILLAIDFFLLALDIISTRWWSEDFYLFGYFSYLHIILIIVPSIFLIIVNSKKFNLNKNITLCKFLHRSIIWLVLVLCALISICNAHIDRMPYPYIIAMFCIGSAVMLEGKERFSLYISTYLLYIIGCVVIGSDVYHLVRNTFFITILVALALIVSQLHYSSFLNDFINYKTILDKNKELDKLFKASEDALIKRTEELQETVEYEKLRAAFFANISHELRTPLTVIFSAEQMLNLIIKKEDFPQGKAKDMKMYMDVIRQNCYRLIRLVANLIDITKIDAGYFSVNLKNCDIVKVIEDITLSVAKFIETRGINLIFDTDCEELIAACDPDKIERIMLNLLSNAVKFTPNGGCIYVNVRTEQDIISIHVKDTGIGIPENMKESIFERFIQVDKSISRNHEGSGIGLSLVKSLINLHNGNISLNSQEGKGSEFIIQLPKVILDYHEKIEEFDFVSEKQNVEKINIEFSDIYQ
jgi:signal transduction histidine kinase